MPGAGAAGAAAAGAGGGERRKGATRCGVEARDSPRAPTCHGASILLAA